MSATVRLKHVQTEVKGQQPLLSVASWRQVYCSVHFHQKRTVIALSCFPCVHTPQMARKNADKWQNPYNPLQATAWPTWCHQGWSDEPARRRLRKPSVCPLLGWGAASLPWTRQAGASGPHSKKYTQRMLSSWVLHRRHIHLGNTSTVNDKMYCWCD
jgi:hypothetical protein